MPPKNKGASGKGGGKGGKSGGKDKGGAADAGQQKEKKGGTTVKVPGIIMPAAFIATPAPSGVSTLDSNTYYLILAYSVNVVV